MSIRRNAFAILCFAALGLAVLGLAALALPSAAHAQSADLVLCDRVAADPSDPDKPAEVKGVADIAPADVAIAIRYCKASARSSRRALYQLGRAYAANRQMAEAAAAFRQAADKGNSSAMVELGVMLGTGNGVATDTEQARALFERAAEAGNPRGVTNLAALTGGTPTNAVKARELLMKAADSNPEAQYQLGLMLADGSGGPKDDVGARALFEKAAALGHVGAMVQAGAFAQIGRGGPQNTSVAKAHFARAAALGNEEAKDRLKRIECPYVVKDKQGNVLSNLCF